MKQLAPGTSLSTAVEEQQVYAFPLAPPDALDPLHEASIHQYFRVLVKHRWVILATLVIISAIVTIATYRMTPIYESAGRIVINRSQSGLLPFNDGSQEIYDPYDTSELETQVRILQSDELGLEVAKKISPEERAALLHANAAEPESAVADLSRQQREYNDALTALKSGLKVAIVPRTRIVEIRFASDNPKLSAAIVNATIDAYIEHNIRSHFESTTQTSEWLAKQLSDLQLKVETTQQKLLDYQKDRALIGVDDKQNIISAKLDELNRELTAAENDRIQKEASYRLALSGDAELISVTAPGQQQTLLSKLREQEAELKTQAAQASVQFGPSYPKVVELRTQLAQVQASIRAEIQKNTDRLRTDYEVALQREKLLRDELEKQKGEANRLAENSIGYALLKRDADTSRQLYEGLLQKLKEAQVSAGLKSSNIQIVDMARVPTSPARPNKRMNISLGLLLGLGCGIGLAFLLEALDTTIRTPEEATAITALPSLGVIPLSAEEPGPRPKLLPAGGSSDQRSNQLIAYLRPRSQAAEAFRALRTSLLLAGSGAPPKIIMFTSALPRDGKTTNSVNCATVLAQMGARVLLIDADLRKPAVHKAFNIPNRAGLSKLLASGQGLDAVALPSAAIPGLDIITAGATPPHPAELLGSGFFLQCLQHWREQYDHIVVDTPPVLSVTDAVVVSVQADAVVLVARAGETSKHALRHARALLANVKARVIGVLLNGVDLTSPDYYYYSSYYSYSKDTSYYDSSTN